MLFLLCESWVTYKKWGKVVTPFRLVTCSIYFMFQSRSRCNRVFRNFISVLWKKQEWSSENKLFFWWIINAFWIILFAIGTAFVWLGEIDGAGAIQTPEVKLISFVVLVIAFIFPLIVPNLKEKHKAKESVWLLYDNRAQLFSDLSKKIATFMPIVKRLH